VLPTTVAAADRAFLIASRVETLRKSNPPSVPRIAWPCAIAHSLVASSRAARVRRGPQWRRAYAMTRATIRLLAAFSWG
jgi:hypothetical protein